MPNGWRTIKSLRSTQNSTSQLTRERNGGILLARKIKACTAERRWMRNPVWPSSCVTPAGTSNELDVQNEWEENTHTNTHIRARFTAVYAYMGTVTHIARVWINRVRLPILLVVNWTGKMNISLSAFAPENLVSRDGFGIPVPRQPFHFHTRAEYGAYLRDSSWVPRRRPCWRSLPRVRRHRASKPHSSSERVLPWQVTMDQLIYASISHTHYRYEVGMLKLLSSYVYVYGHHNRARLPILLVVS